MLSKPNYLDPLGSRLPALERSIHKYRTLVMVLIIYHVEELKNEIVEDVLAQQNFFRSTDIGTLKKNLKWPEALRIMEVEGIVTGDERNEIGQLVSFRNNIAHEIHKLFADLSSDRFTREIAEFEQRGRTFDYNASDRLRQLRETIKQRQYEKHRLGVLSFRARMFESADRIYRDEIKRLDVRIRRLVGARRRKMDALNAEFSLSHHWQGEFHPDSPYNRYENGRLTARGIEICFRLFDEGKSPMAVSHLMRVKLASIKRRHQQWQALGRSGRAAVDFRDLPKRKFYRSYDD